MLEATTTAGMPADGAEMNIVVMPGDDIGPEIVEAAMQVVHAAERRFSLGLSFETVDVGMPSFRKVGSTLTDEAIAKAVAADGVILGPCGMTLYPPRDKGGINVPGTIRKRLDLYANLRPARSRAAVPDARRGMDMLIVRENTEGFYSDRNMFMGIGEFMPTPDLAISVRKITRNASRRISRVAFEWALRRRKKVTAVGKQHVLQMSDGLFMEEAYAAAKANPGVEFHEFDVDAMAAELYSRPERHDVVLLTNMFGDILSNAAVAISGGLGLAAALNAGDDHAVANAGHGSAPDIAGRGIANPTGMILSTAMLFEWLGVKHSKPVLVDASQAITAAVDAALADDGARTGDLGGRGNTRLFAERVVAALG
jgi:3-isopropylmalate dehydrogenase